MSLVQGNRRAPMATHDDDPPDDDNNPSDWRGVNGDGHNTREGTLMSGGRPLSPGASYIFLKSDLSDVARLEEYDQEKIATGFFSEVYKVRNYVLP